MKLYFENSRGQRRIIAEPQTEDEVWDEIRNFCNDRNFVIPYVRSWQDPDGLKWYDVSSHSEYFILDERN